MNYINWKHPVVEKLISDYVENRPEALSQAQIARAISAILNRDIKPQNIYRRITSLKQQQSIMPHLQQSNSALMFSTSAPYSTNIPKQREALKENSFESALDAFMEKMNEMNAFLSSVKQTAANLKNSFASSENIIDRLEPNVNLKGQENQKLQLKPPQPFEFSYLSNSAQHLTVVQNHRMPFNEMPNVDAAKTMNQCQHQTNVLNSNPMTPSEIMNKFFSSSDNFMIQSKSNENLKEQGNLEVPQMNGQLEFQSALRKTNLKAGLNSKLYPCLLLETKEGKIYEYSFVFEKNGFKYYKCEQCSNLNSSNKSSNLKIYIDGVGEHLSTCTPSTKFLSAMIQACRHERVAAAQSHNLFGNGLEIVDGNFCEFRTKDGIPNAELIIHNNFKYYYEKSQNIYFCYECHNVTAKIHFKEGNGEMYVTLGKNAHRCHM